MQGDCKPHKGATLISSNTILFTCRCGKKTCLKHKGSSFFYLFFFFSWPEHWLISSSFYNEVQSSLKVILNVLDRSKFQICSGGSHLKVTSYDDTKSRTTRRVRRHLGQALRGLCYLKDTLICSDYGYITFNLNDYSMRLSHT